MQCIQTQFSDHLFVFFTLQDKARINNKIVFGRVLLVFSSPVSWFGDKAITYTKIVDD